MEPNKRIIIAASTVFVIFAFAVTLALVFPYKNLNPDTAKTHWHETSSADGSGDFDEDALLALLAAEELEHHSLDAHDAHDPHDAHDAHDDSHNDSHAEHPIQPLKESDEKPDELTDFYLSYLLQNEHYSNCYTPLHAADADSDGLLSNDEYVDFLSHFSKLDFDNEVYKVTAVEDVTYLNLPYVMQVNYVHLSCLCDDGDCCEGDTRGIFIGELFTVKNAGEGVVDEMEQYLDRVCRETEVALELALEEVQMERQGGGGSGSIRGMGGDGSTP